MRSVCGWRPGEHTHVAVVLVMGALVSGRERVGLGVVEQGVVPVPPWESLGGGTGCTVRVSVASHSDAILAKA